MQNGDEYTCGMSLYKEEKYLEAFIVFERLNDIGDADATSMMAIMYGSGLGVEENIQKSIELDIVAHKRGSFTSAFNLALTYKKIDKIYDAELWFNNAIELGDDEAYIELAKILLKRHYHKTILSFLLNSAIERNSISENALTEAKLILRSL